LFEKTSPQEIKKRRAYNKEYFEKLNSLSEKQKEFFLSVVSYAEIHGFDFKVPDTIRRDWPEDYDKIIFLFQ
jgi:hypothetical protein